MTYANPYLLSLGMSKSRLSLVWVAGPLSGLVVQPVVGVLSDRSTSKYGRRRPYMLAGTAAVAVCYAVLGWSKEIAWFWVRDEDLVSLKWSSRRECLGADCSAAGSTLRDCAGRGGHLRAGFCDQYRCPDPNPNDAPTDANE